MTDVQSLPRAEPPCIWAEAGILSYRLCDRHYDCEGCPLFQALSGGRQPATAGAPAAAAAGPAADGPGAAPVAAYLARLLAGCTLRLDRTYSAGHWWLDGTQPPGLMLGLEEHALRVLAPIDDVVIPHPGARLQRSAACAWIVRGRAAVPLPAPVGGSVDEINRHYADAVRTWGRQQGEDEWLMRLAPDEPLETVPDLYRGEAALMWHLQNLQLLREVLREAVEQGGGMHEVGPTLADGGEPSLDLERVLGHGRFEALVARMFPMPAS